MINSSRTDLINYIDKHLQLDDPNKAKSNIKKIRAFGLERIMEEQIRKLDEKECSRIKVEMLMQKALNSIVEEELFSLGEQCEKNNIKMMSFKGLPLAFDLYNPKELRRAGDIDILVYIDDFYKTAEICCNAGYCTDLANNTFDKCVVNNFFNNPLRPNHMDPIYKKIMVYNRPINLTLEIHTELLPNFYFSNLAMNTADVMQRRINIEGLNKNLWCLELHDNIIYLLMHFIKHYTFAGMGLFVDGMVPNNVALNKLHDVSLLIDKYFSEIDWKIIYDRTLQWKLENQMALAIRIFSRIYPGRVSDKLLYNMEEHVLPGVGFLDRICSAFYSIDTDELILGNFFKMVTDNIPRLKEGVPTIKCQYYKGPINNADDSSFVIDEHSGSIKNRFGTHISDWGIPVSSKDCSASGQIFWDEQYLYFNIYVHDDVVVFGDENDDVNSQDYVELLFDTCKREEGEPLVRMLKFVPRKSCKGVYLDILEQVNDNTTSWDKSEYRYNIEILDNGYKVDVCVPWVKIHIKPYTGMGIGLDIAVIDCDDARKGIKSRLAWSCAFKSWYDITSYGVLQLEP